MLLFNTYLLRSGSRQGGQTRRATPFAVHPQRLADLRQVLHRGLLNPSESENPSRERPPTYLPRPNPTPRINTAKASKICGVIFKGMVVAIFLLRIPFFTISTLSSLPEDIPFVQAPQDPCVSPDASISFWYGRASCSHCSHAPLPADNQSPQDSDQTA